MGVRFKPSEAQIQNAILQFLAVERIFAGRINTGGRRMVRGVLIPATHTFGAGTPDILAFPHRISGGLDYGPRPLWIECKNDTGKQTPEQHYFEDYVLADGHGYIVARSVDDVKAWLEEHR